MQQYGPNTLALTTVKSSLVLFIIVSSPHILNTMYRLDEDMDYVEGQIKTCGWFRVKIKMSNFCCNCLNVNL